MHGIGIYCKANPGLIPNGSAFFASLKGRVIYKFEYANPELAY